MERRESSKVRGILFDGKGLFFFLFSRRGAVLFSFIFVKGKNAYLMFFTTDE
jgi:hypothetical protein